jgi:hypothetical protein
LLLRQISLRVIGSGRIPDTRHATLRREECRDCFGGPGTGVDAQSQGFKKEAPGFGLRFRNRFMVPRADVAEPVSSNVIPDVFHRVLSGE